MNNVAWTASYPPGDKLKWKALCGHLMPTEYADYVTFVFGFVHVWCCHKFVCLCVVEGQRDVTQVFVCMYVSMYVFMYVCMYVCM